jgi:hypothetical protein
MKVSHALALTLAAVVASVAPGAYATSEPQAGSVMAAEQHTMNPADTSATAAANADAPAADVHADAPKVLPPPPTETAPNDLDLFKQMDQMMQTAMAQAALDMNAIMGAMHQQQQHRAAPPSINLNALLLEKPIHDAIEQALKTSDAVSVEVDQLADGSVVVEVDSLKAAPKGAAAGAAQDVPPIAMDGLAQEVQAGLPDCMQSVDMKMGTKEETVNDRFFDRATAWLHQQSPGVQGLVIGSAGAMGVGALLASLFGVVAVGKKLLGGRRRKDYLHVEDLEAVDAQQEENMKAVAKSGWF